MNFFDKLSAAVERNQSLLCVGLDPNPDLLPSRYGSNLTPESLLGALRDWLHEVIAQSSELVCAYKPTLGFYTALGSGGLDLLQQILAAVPAEIPVILDAKHSDLVTAAPLARTMFTQWRVDAVTLSPYAGQDLVAPFLLYPGKAVFVLCRTANAAAVAVQGAPGAEAPLYLQLVNEAKTWGPPEQLGLELGTSQAEVLARVRAAAPERLILLRGLWSAGSDLTQMLAAGLNTSGSGLIVPVPQEFLGQIPAAPPIRALRDAIQQQRAQTEPDRSTCAVWFADVCLLNQSVHADLILQLYDLGCVKFGSFVQASGATFPYYIDLRTVISNPQVFHAVLNAYTAVLQTLQFDRIAGIPYGSLPTATGLALRLGYPMIFPRKEVKAHGTRRLIEGYFQPGETVVVVDDILISGKSALEGAQKLASVGLNVQDIVVLIDHGQGVQDKLQANGYRGHAVLSLAEIAETLYQAGRIREEQFQLLGGS